MKKEQENLPENKEKKEYGEVSRRDFLVGAGTVVVGGAIGAGLLSSCGETVTTTVKETSTKTVPTTVVVGEGTPITVTETKTIDGSGGAVTITETKTVTGGVVDEPETSTIHNFGLGDFGHGGEPSCVDSKDGKIVRIRPLHYDEWLPKEEVDATQWKYDIRGKVYSPPRKSLPSYFGTGYKSRIYSPRRILFPVQRVDWEPGGVNVNPQNRGKSKYKRITWEQATDIVASEIKRITTKYGLAAVLTCDEGHGECKSVHAAHGAPQRLMGWYGGYTQEVRNADSWEGWYWGSMHVWGTMSVGIQNPNINTLWDVCKNSEMVICQGCDWNTTIAGFDGQGLPRMSWYFTELGIKQVYICPDLNYSAAVHADKWIPVYPNTDAALQLAIIYEWVMAGTYEKEYIATHAVGMDKIEAYVKGEVDGVAKTPEWAAPLCGVPEWTIKALAKVWAEKTTSMVHCFGGSFIRGPYSHEPARLEQVLLAMRALGKPGVQQLHGRPGMPRAIVKRLSYRNVNNPAPFQMNQFLPKTQVAHAILNKSSYTYGTTAIQASAEDQFVKYVYPLPEDQGGAQIRMIWMSNPCHIPCWNDGFMWIRAFRDSSIECIVTQHAQWENDCEYSDIVLPVSTNVELTDIMMNRNDTQVSSICIQEAAIDHIGESMSDYEMCIEISKKLGIYEDYTGGKTVEEWMQTGWSKSGAQDVSDWEAIQEKKLWICPVAEDWEEDVPGLTPFYLDPEKNPLYTPNGKLCLWSQALYDHFPDDKERPPYPQWVVGGPASEGWTHDESRVGDRVKDYPLLMVSNHPRWRHHVQCDDIAWIREIPTCKIRGWDGYQYEPIWIHPDDAKERDIEQGDIVKIYNERGIVLGAALLTEGIIPGAVLQDHGTKIDIITDGLDRAGSNNLICPGNGTSKNCWGEATSGYLVEVEKLSWDEMNEWRKTYPEAFAREYDPGQGGTFNAWIEGGSV